MNEIIPGTNWFAEFTNDVNIAFTNEFGFAILINCIGNPNVVATQVGIYTTGCTCIREDILSGDNLYYNRGTLAAPSWAQGVPASGITVGTPITGGADNSILIENSSGNLAVSTPSIADTFLAWNGTNFVWESFSVLSPDLEDVLMAGNSTGGINIISPDGNEVLTLANGVNQISSGGQISVDAFNRQLYESGGQPIITYQSQGNLFFNSAASLGSIDSSQPAFVIQGPDTNTSGLGMVFITDQGITPGADISIVYGSELDSSSAYWHVGENVPGTSPSGFGIQNGNAGLVMSIGQFGDTAFNTPTFDVNAAQTISLESGLGVFQIDNAGGNVFVTDLSNTIVGDFENREFNDGLGNPNISFGLFGTVSLGDINAVNTEGLFRVDAPDVAFTMSDTGGNYFNINRSLTQYLLSDFSYKSSLDVNSRIAYGIDGSTQRINWSGSGVTINNAYALPTSAGTTGQVLAITGSAITGFVTPNAGTVTSVTSANANATVANTITTPVITIVSAPKWTTARNLAGNSVDGSANVAFSNKFIVQGTTDAGLSGAQFMGALGTGIVKNTTGTGVLSIASITDFASLGLYAPTTADLTGRTASVASVVTATSPNDANKHQYEVGGYIDVTAISAGTVTITYTFTDEAGNSRTLTLFPMGLTAAGVSATGFIAFPTSTIRVNPNTAITMVATFTGVSVSYDVGGNILQKN